MEDLRYFCQSVPLSFVNKLDLNLAASVGETTVIDINIGSITAV